MVVDMFQTDIFWEVLNENPQYKKIFKEFIYFPDCLGGFPTTYASVPFLLTGNSYDNSIPIQQFMQKAYLSDTSIPKVLRENGFETQIFFDSKKLFIIIKA